MVNIGDMKDEFIRANKINQKGQIEMEGNVKTGDILTILTAGERDTEGEYGERLVVDVSINEDSDETLKYSFNKTSLRAAASVWGDDTGNWIGGRLKVSVAQSMISGSLKNVVYTEPVEPEVEKETPAETSAETSVETAKPAKTPARKK